MNNREKYHKKYFIELDLLNDIIQYFITKRFKLLRKIAKIESKEPRK